MKISKAKLTKGGTLEVAFVDDDGNDVTMKGKNIVHEDLRNRLNALIPYFAELTEQREAPMIDWRNPGGDETQELLHRISVTGVSITGTDDLDRQCVLIGKRTLATSKVLNVTAPLTGFDPEMESYERCEDLRDTVDAFIYECQLYLTEKKWGMVVAEIPFDNDNEGDPFDKVEAPEAVAA